MLLRSFKPVVLLLGLGAGILSAQSLAERRATLPARQNGQLKGHDLALERIEAARMWFGGEASPEYLDFKAGLSRREMQRWFPAEGAHLLPALPGTSSVWTNLGPRANLTTASYPDMDSGRLNSIVTHPSNPNLVYVATSTGGVFKCTNADPASATDWTWTPITDTLPNSSSSGNIPVGAMAMSPADPNTLYIGLGDFTDDQGRGFYRSVNGGNTWTEATGIGNATRTTCILPLSASTILWGTNDGLKISTDGGASFNPVNAGGTGNWAWSAIAFSPTEVAVVRATLRSGYKWSFQSGAIWWSNDAGATWTQGTVTGLASFGRVSLVAAPGTSTGWGLAEATSPIANMARGLLKTTDKGHTWTWVAAPTASGGLFQGIGNQMTGDGGQAGYNQAIAVHPTNPNQVTVGANLALYRTDDGGLTWNQLTHWYGNRHVYAHADFHCTGWSQTGTPVLFVGGDGGLCVIRNPAIAAGSIPTGASGVASDVTFIDNRRNKGLASHQVYHLGSTNASTPADSRYRVTLGLQDNGTRVRQDAGAGMQASATFEDQIGGDGFGTQIHPLNGNLMLGSYYYTNILKSLDGGTTGFDPSSIGIAESDDANAAPFYTRIAMGPADPTGNTVYTHVNTLVYKSINFGTSWTPMGMTGFDTNKVIRQLNAAASDAQTVAVVTSSGTGFKTINAGGNWTQFGTFPNNSSSMSYVWFDTGNAQTLYAASVAPLATASHLWKSTNGGSTWTALDANPGFPAGIPVHVIQNDSTNSSTLLAGTDFGVYQSTDGGATWARYGQGLPLVSVRDLYIAPDGSFVRAATYGRGVWELAGSVTPPTGPTISVHPQNQTVTAPATALFSVSATGTGTLTYQWQKNGADIALANASSYTTPATSPADDGAQFRVRVTDSAGSLYSNAATLTVVSCGGGGTTQILQNEGFENGTSPWVAFDPSMFQPSGTGGAVSHGGGFMGWVGTWDTPTTDYLYQTVTIPSNATAAQLSFYLTIGNFSATPTSVANVMTLKLRTSSGIDITPLATWNNTQANYPTYALQGPYNLLAYKGQTVQVYFTSVQPGGANSGTGFLLDDFTLNVTTGSTSTQPVISTHPASQTLTVGQSATFTVATSAGTAPLTYQWRKNTVAIPGATLATYTIPSAQVADSGSYDCQVSNCAGTATSNAATLTVGAAVSVSISPLTTTSTVTGGQLTFTATVTGSGNTAVTWLLLGGGSLNSTTANTVTFTAASVPGGTTLTATSAASSSASATVAVTTKTADLNGDVASDILDLALLARAYGSHPGDGNWNAAADLNGDGTVNDLDLALFFTAAGF